MAEGHEPRRFEPSRRSDNEISQDDMRPRIVTHRIGDMRAVMIEGPSREAVNLSSAAPALMSISWRTVRNVTVLSLRFGTFESRAPINNDMSYTRRKEFQLPSTPRN